MAKKQTRRSLSVTGSIYRRLQALSQRERKSVSAIVEAAIVPLIEGIADPGGQPRPVKRRPGAEPPSSPFTF